MIVIISFVSALAVIGFDQLTKFIINMVAEQAQISNGEYVKI